MADKKARILGWDGPDFYMEVDGKELCRKDARIVSYEPGTIEAVGMEVVDIEFVEIEK